MASSPPIRNVSAGRSKRLAMMLFSDPGIGKTRLVGSCGRVAPTLILRPPTDHTDSITETTDVDEWVLHDWAEAEDALAYCRMDGGDKYEFVALDSISLFQDTGLDDIWEVLISEKPHRKQWGLDKGEFGVNMQRLARWVRAMVGCPDFHFIVTAHTQELPIAEHDKAPDKLMPWVQGKNMSSKICGMMNLVAYLDVNTKGARVLHTDATKDFYAKNLLGGLPDGRLANPTMAKLMEAVTPGLSKPRRRKRVVKKNITTNRR